MSATPFQVVLDTSVLVAADCIITHNVRVFAGAERLGVVILTPSEFLKKLS